MTDLDRSTRVLAQRTKGVPAQDGAGVKLTRIIGTPELNMIDPFLLLDHFSSDRPDDYIGGFPDHPHRGFETVTYMLAGRSRHKDSAGHEGAATFSRPSTETRSCWSPTTSANARPTTRWSSPASWL